MKDLDTSNKMHRGLDKNKVSTKFHKKCSVYKHNLNQICSLSWPGLQGFDENMNIKYVLLSRNVAREWKIALYLNDR